MKFLVVFAVLFLMQTIGGQEIQQGHKQDQHNQGHVGVQDQVNVAGHKAQVTSAATQTDKEQQHQIVPQHVSQHIVQHVAKEQHKPTVNQQNSVQHPTKSHVSNPTPSKVQTIVSPVSQQKPMVSMQHVNTKNKQRMSRSLVNRRVGQQPYKIEEVPGKCNFICDQINLTVCGFNGQCHREFESQCELNIYNCINTNKIFHIVDDISCMDTTTVKCYEGDM